MDAADVPRTRRYRSPVGRLVTAALAPTRNAHDRQRELVQASLIARPPDARATRRRRS
jgi:hypothetical protein